MNKLLFETEQDLIYLIRCAFDGSMPTRLHKDLSLENLYALSKYHNVTNILYLPLSKVFESSEIMEKFRLTYRQKMQYGELQSIYLEKITDEFEKNGIEHCVMKGPVIKNLYPRSDFRQSGDIDIYINPKKREEARKLMEKLGFSVIRYDLDDADDVYENNNKIHIELHRILISDSTPWQKKCQKITDRLLLKENKKYSYEMSLEDYYLYMIAHMAKHMYYSGMGIKMVLDVWVYMKVYKDKLDWKVLNKRLLECKLSKFEQNMRKLVEYWFYDADAEDTIKIMGFYILGSGTFGTLEQHKTTDFAMRAGSTDNKLFAKITLMFKAAFMPYSLMSKKYPILQKMPFLLPFCWIYRGFAATFTRKTAEIAEGLNSIDENELKTGKTLLEFKRNIGL